MRARAGHLADTLAREVLAHYGVGHRPQIDPWMLADALGVPVFDSNRLEDGCVTWVDGRPIVMLALGAPLERRRFTLAHELGHVLLRTDQLASPTLLATQNAFHSEEILCDALAGALLMPRAWVSGSFRRTPHSLSVVQTLARTAGVSLSAALVRLREIHHWQRTLLQWRADKGSWIYDAEAGIWPSEQGLIKSCEGTAWALSAQRSGGNALRLMNLPLRIGNDDREIHAEVRFTGHRALVLIDSPSRLLML